LNITTPKSRTESELSKREMSEYEEWKQMAAENNIEVELEDEDVDASWMIAKESENKLPASNRCITRFVLNPWFEAFFVGLIILNTVVAAIEAQYNGFDWGYRMRYSRMTARGTDIWPHWSSFQRALDIGFAALYTLELGLKLIGLNLSFFKCAWNLFDMFLVGSWYVLEFYDASSVINPMILRLARLARLMRLVRHCGWFEAFDSLHMLISAIRSSFTVLVWSTLLLFVLFVVGALVANGTFSGYLEDVDINDNRTMQEKREVYMYFGTFSRSFVSVFELAFANHSPILRTLMENVGEPYAIYVLIYKLVISLSVMRVITGVFLHETFKVCSEDDELMVMNKMRTAEKHLKRMEVLFQTLNTDGDDALTWEEFKFALHDKWIRSWLDAMDLDPHHMERLWTLLDNGDGRLTSQELIRGVATLRGHAKSMDLNYVSVCVEALSTTLRKVSEKVGDIQAKQDLARGYSVSGSQHLLHHTAPLCGLKSGINKLLESNGCSTMQSHDVVML
jgi:hypothetical protein